LILPRDKSPIYNAIKNLTGFENLSGLGQNINLIKKLKT
jgi:hypothetical protein